MTAKKDHTLMRGRENAKKIFYQTSEEIGRQVEVFFEKNPKLKDNVHARGFIGFFQGRVNLHINWSNFNLIERYFTNQRGSELTVLDLGTGFGDKAVIFQNLFPRSKIYGVETINTDDPHMKESPPHKIFEKFYPFFRKSFGVNLGLYGGLKLEFPDNYFDIILLYAVIEHIDPKKRKKFIKEIGKTLKSGGHIVITRCPRQYSLTEFMARNLGLAHHPWLLSKKELLEPFDEKDYEVRVIKSLSNVPSNPRSITNKFAPLLILLDYVLSLLHWPFASDYFLILRKR